MDRSKQLYRKKGFDGKNTIFLCDRCEISAGAAGIHGCGRGSFTCN